MMKFCILKKKFHNEVLDNSDFDIHMQIHLFSANLNFKHFSEIFASGDLYKTVKVQKHSFNTLAFLDRFL